MKYQNTLLFVTRKWLGKGGMQQLSRDLWRGIRETYGDQTRLCVLPWGAGTVLRRGHMHVHLGDVSLVCVGWLWKKRGCRVTIMACGLDVIWKPNWYQWMVRKFLPTMDKVVCISEATAQEVRKRGVCEEKIVVVPCGVWGSSGERSHFDRPACRTDRLSVTRSPIIITVGRLIPRKGQVWFIENVLPKLREMYPDIQYWIVGSGPDEKKVRSLMKYRDGVRLFTRASSPVRDRLLEHADLFVMPNIIVEGDMEGFGLVCLEAAAQGVPVAAAQIEGVRDAVKEGQTGKFFTSGNAEDCVRVIDGMLCDVFCVSRYALEQYDWSSVLQRYRDEVFS
ncbi:hypothetical protein COU77_00820 [Candidatus Peregrinibacteria bacterium CG10_big_fil_rev_8_21_14_0_10_49_16]|nr:MAG: hypothetical protein COU77_00820 [Candidatus Peregrinibacteria bacterium CG10_big_fil_rev_8_21_14_0_10_49_16]